MAPDNTDLNEIFEEDFDDATVVTVPIDTTLTRAGEAAEAKAVGDALALKADRSELSAAINVNGQSADAQGTILLYGGDIPLTDATGAQNVQEAVEALAARTGATIPISSVAGAETIAEAIEDAAGRSAEDILMTPGGTLAVAEKIRRMDSSISLNANNIMQLQNKRGDAIYLQAGSQETVAEAVAGRVKTVNGYGPDAAGNVNVQHALTADDLTSSRMQTSVGTFVRRTSGGEASIKDGPARFSAIRGNSVHTGQSAESCRSWDELMPREAGEEDPVFGFNQVTFKEKVGGVAASMSWTYSGQGVWNPSNIRDYGIMLMDFGGSWKAGDVIYAEFVPENRGTITNATPESFTATGWNLYNHDLGYAVGLKYAEAARFRIEGTYTKVEFSTTPAGTRTEILPDADGTFEISSTGYIIVTGGNAVNTAVYMVWGDWESQSPGAWEAYTESTVDLSEIMAECFPYGLMRVGLVRDEINFSSGLAISRVERIAWSQEAQEAAAESGKAWDADTNYIYIERDAPAETAIETGGLYTVSDHGLEFFTETTVGVYTVIIYGQSLKNKLERDVLTVSAQDLTAAQQAQVRENIGAAGADVGTVITGTNASSMTVTTGTTTTLSTISALPAGTWILTGHVQWSSGFDQNYVLSMYAGSQIGESIIRNTGASGGGSVTMAVVSPTSDTTYTLRVSQNSGSNKTASNVVFRAVRVA